MPQSRPVYVAERLHRDDIYAHQKCKPVAPRDQFPLPSEGCPITEDSGYVVCTQSLQVWLNAKAG